MGNGDKRKDSEREVERIATKQASKDGCLLMKQPLCYSVHANTDMIILLSACAAVPT